MRTRKGLPFAAGLLCGCLLSLTGGCSYFKLKTDQTQDEPGIVILERKASPDIEGFNVYRVNPEDGTEVQINSRPIRPASQIADKNGLVTYRVIDRGVVAGLDYYYVFEEIAKDGTKTRWDTPQLKTAQSLDSVTVR